MHNPTSGTELGILTDKDLDIFVLFEFEDIGYVKDAEKDKLDGDDILKSIREGNEASNEARKERGWPAITIVGWHTPRSTTAKPTTSSGASRARARATRSSTTTPGSSAARA